MVKISISKELCKGCKICVEFCPEGILRLGEEVNKHGYRVITVDDPDKCILCYNCVRYCPDFAIYIIK